MKDIKLTYDEVLNETSEYFNMRGVSITGAGYKEIATDQGLLEEYIENLTAGMDNANSQASMAQLLMNSNTNTLLEASINGITPIASLSMPVIRKLWPKFAMKDAIKHEVAKTPRFAVSYQRPYMFKKSGEKVYLPNEIFNKQEARRGSAIRRQREILDLRDVAAAEGIADTATSISFKASAHFAEEIHKTQPIDKDVSVSINGRRHPIQTIGGAAQIFYDETDKSKMAFISIDKSTSETQIAFVGGDTIGTFVDGIADDPNTGANEFVAAGFTIELPISEEFNETGYSVSFDVDRKDIEIPTGQHINAPMPLEWINDNRALYNIDSTKEVVDLMTNVTSQKLDLEVLEFLDKEFEAYDSNDVTKFSRKFDLRPAAGFAGSPKAWREELKPIIDDLAVMIKDATYFNEGKFSIIGHPRDLNLLQNVDWTFRGGTGTQVDGVNVEYSKGLWQGVYTYEVFSSLNHPQGDMTMIFTPATNTQYTYKYYPYTFNIEHKYLDPNRQNVPSIMMTKRHTFGSFTPAIGRIFIYSNNGQSAYKNEVSFKDNHQWGNDLKEV